VHLCSRPLAQPFFNLVLIIVPKHTLRAFNRALIHPDHFQTHVKMTGSFYPLFWFIFATMCAVPHRLASYPYLHHIPMSERFRTHPYSPISVTYWPSNTARNTSTHYRTPAVRYQYPAWLTALWTHPTFPSRISYLLYLLPSAVPEVWVVSSLMLGRIGTMEVYSRKVDERPVLTSPDYWRWPLVSISLHQ